MIPFGAHASLTFSDGEGLWAQSAKRFAILFYVCDQKLLLVYFYMKSYLIPYQIEMALERQVRLVDRSTVQDKGVLEWNCKINFWTTLLIKIY